MKELIMIPGVFLVVLAVISHSGRSDAARILCVSHQFGSSMLMVHSIAEGLIERGHEVYTIFSDRMPVPKGLVEKGFKVLYYHTPDTSDIVGSKTHLKEMLQTILGPKDRASFRSFSNTSRSECSDIDNDIELSKQLFNLRFDLAIIQGSPVSNCLLFLTLKLNVAFVMVPATLDLELTRNPVLPSFSPSVLSLFTDEMSFLERLHNTYLAILVNCPIVNQFPSVTDTSLLKKYNRNPSVTSWIELARKAELYFHTGGSVVEYPSPLTPNVISVECITCKPGRKLPRAIEEQVDNSEGIIVFSFGSLIDDLPDSLVLKFVEALSNRSELVFWRFNGKLPISVPSNLKVMQWLPQNDLLAHHKTKLFITHAGNNGQHEAVYHGVPMLAFPIFAEQPHNAVRIVKHGFGLKVDIQNFTACELSDLINEVTQNPSYRENTQKAGQIMKSDPMGAQDKAAYWIEHVLEFGGDHLRSHAMKMPWYSFYMIDIILFVEGIIAAVICILACVGYYVAKRVVILRQNRSKINSTTVQLSVITVI